MKNRPFTLPNARFSNIELLRVVAMFLILVQHVNYEAIVWIRAEDFATDILPATTRVLVEQISVCAVNLFVLISGWFGIRTRRKKVIALLFQYFFFACLLAVVPGLLQTRSLSGWLATGRELLGFDSFWFVPAYLMLCLLAPALNSFVTHSTRRTLRTTLVAFFLFQTVWGWVLGDAAAGMFSCGYSAISFVGLYLLARYVRLYRPRPFRLRSRSQYLVAVTFIACPAAVSLILAFAWDGSLFDAWYGRSILYSAPHVILCALFILTATARLHFVSPGINKIAASAFAVYLFHLHPCVFPYFKQAVLALAGHFSGVAFLAVVFVFIVTVFAVAVLVDQVRLACWQPLARRFFARPTET